MINIVVYAGVIIGLSLLIFFLIYEIIRLHNKINKYDVLYVDTSGVGENPPRFIETWQGKTINFKVNEKHSVKIQHFSFFENIF